MQCIRRLAASTANEGRDRIAPLATTTFAASSPCEGIGTQPHESRGAYRFCPGPQKIKVSEIKVSDQSHSFLFKQPIPP